MGVIYSDDFKDEIIEFMEGDLPRFSPLILRLIGGACCAVILIAFSPKDAPTILWVIGGILCVLPAIYTTLLNATEEETLADALDSFKELFMEEGLWKGVLFVLLLILMTAIRALHWAIAYAMLGGIAFVISLIF